MHPRESNSHVRSIQSMANISEDPSPKETWEQWSGYEALMCGCSSEVCAVGVRKQRNTCEVERTLNVDWRLSGHRQIGRSVISGLARLTTPEKIRAEKPSHAIIVRWHPSFVSSAVWSNHCPPNNRRPCDAPCCLIHRQSPLIRWRSPGKYWLQ